MGTTKIIKLVTYIIKPVIYIFNYVHMFLSKWAITKESLSDISSIPQPPRMAIGVNSTRVYKFPIINHCHYVP